jgi:hypothetical protein
VITDPNWLLEILRAAGWKSLGIAAGSFIAVALFPLPDWLKPVLQSSGCISGGIAVAALLEHLVTRYNPEGAISDLVERRRWRHRLQALPREAREVLSLMEADGLDQLYFDPRHTVTSTLRDVDVLVLTRGAPGSSWGVFELTDAYVRSYHDNRPMFRAALRCPHTDLDWVREEMALARRRAGALR